MILQALSRHTKSIRRSHFLKNLSIVMFGTALSQLITIASLPLITRLYSAEYLGYFGVFMAIFSLLSTLSTGRYSLAVMLPKSDDDSISLVVLCFFVTLLMSSLSLLLFLFSEPIGRLFNLSEVMSYIWVLPIMVVFGGFAEAFEYRLSRLKMFVVTSIAIIAGSLLANGFKIIMGLEFPRPDWLIIGSLLGFTTQFIVMFFYGGTEIIGFLKERCDYVRVKSLAIEYIYLPQFRAPKDFVNSLSSNSPTVLIAASFSIEQAGFFALADKIMRVPGQFVGLSIRKVFFQKASELYNQNKNITQPLLKITFGIMLLGIIPFGSVILFGPEIFSVILGSEWVTAGEYARWIAVWMFCSFANSPSLVMIPVFKLEKKFFYYELINVFLRLTCLLYGGIVIKDIVFTIISICVIGAIFNMSLIVIIYNICRIEGRKAGVNE